VAAADAAEAPPLDCAALAALPAAVRTRVLRRAALAAGARPDDLTSTHLAAMDALVTDWHGQGAVALPGPVQAVRDCGRLHLARLSDTGAGQETKPSTEE
jgi:tRNA(Ile)-lysidine synthase